MKHSIFEPRDMAETIRTGQWTPDARAKIYNPRFVRRTAPRSQAIPPMSMRQHTFMVVWGMGWIAAVAYGVVRIFCPCQ